jgi:hypothetical protein
VRATAAACIIDVFKVFAPDSPFSDKETVTVFKHLINELGLLSDQKHHLFEVLSQSEPAPL